MKRLLFVIAILLIGKIHAQENVFLTNEYWKQKPSVAQVEQAINQGNSATAFNSRAFDATTLAILNGAPYETIAYLIDLEGNGVDKLTHDKRTYLFWAAYQDNVPVMEYLLKKGAKVNITESHQLTPLLFAAVGGRSNNAIYELLLKHGANLKDTNADGANALLLLLPHLKDLKEADYFVKKGLKLTATDNKGNNAIYYAATTGNRPIIEALMKKKINVKNLNNKGESAIFGAARGAKRNYNKLDTFLYLEQLGLSLNQKNKDGLSPLFVLAEKNKDEKVINYFLEKGNDANQLDKEGNNPLMKSAISNNISVITALLAKTKDINTRNKQGLSALTFAVENNTLEVIDFLLLKNADVQVVDKEENTLYHYAVKRGDIKILEKLSLYPININQKNSNGLTPLQMAVMTAKNLDVVHFLLSKGADKNLTTDLGETVYELAQENEALKGMNVEFLK